MRTVNKVIILAALLAFSSGAMACSTQEQNTDKKPTEITQSSEEGKVVKIDQGLFKQLVWNYEASPKEWKFIGNKPVVIDFYADWCGPCRRLAPIMQRLAEEFKGQIHIYKVNIDHNKELASVFGVKSIPAVLFVPQNEKPAMQPGLMQEDQYRQILKEFVLGIPPEKNKKEITEKN